jgi:hypothetical protein
MKKLLLCLFVFACGSSVTESESPKPYLLNENIILTNQLLADENMNSRFVQDGNWSSWAFGPEENFAQLSLEQLNGRVLWVRLFGFDDDFLKKYLQLWSLSPNNINEIISNMRSNNRETIQYNAGNINLRVALESRKTLRITEL